MTDPLVRTLIAPIVRQATGTARFVLAAAQARARQGARQFATILFAGLVAAFAAVFAAGFLALALHRQIALLAGPTAADLVLALLFALVAIAMLLVMRDAGRNGAPPRAPLFSPSAEARPEEAAAAPGRTGAARRTTPPPRRPRTAGQTGRPDGPEPGLFDDDPRLESAGRRSGEPRAGPGLVFGAMAGALLAGLFLGRR